MRIALLGMSALLSFSVSAKIGHWNGNGSNGRPCSLTIKSDKLVFMEDPTSNEVHTKRVVTALFNTSRWGLIHKRNYSTGVIEIESFLKHDDFNLHRLYKHTANLHRVGSSRPVSIRKFGGKNFQLNLYFHRNDGPYSERGVKEIPSHFRFSAKGATNQYKSYECVLK